MIPKFKVWDKQKEKIFDQSELIIRFDENGVGIVEDHYRADRLKDFELLHSTGLRDNNGTEIFEGDILKVFVLGDEGAIAKVIFKNGMFGIEDDMHGYGYDKGLYSLHQILSLRDAEILGNIYQDKHLLEEE